VGALSGVIFVSFGDGVNCTKS